MFSIRNRTAVLVTLCFVDATTATGQSLIQVVADTGFEPVHSIWHGEQFLGVPGDIIEIERGELDLTMRIGPTPTWLIGPYRVRVTGRVDTQHIDIDTTEFYTSSSACTANMESRDPVKIQLSPTGHVLEVQISLGDIVDTNDPVLCGVGLGPSQRPAIVDFTSTPTGAEIWVDGRKLEYRTDVQLSVPFDRYGDGPYQRLPVLIRLPGFVNQAYEVDFSSRAVEANLETPEQWAARVVK